MLAFPLAVGLALGRQSQRRWLSMACATYIELLRALPLVVVLFIAAFVVPSVLAALLPEAGGAGNTDLLARVVVTIAFFSAAYLAEVLRGGLQALPEGQQQAAYALGLNYPRTMRWVVLPQVIKASAPGLMNSFVTLFKECSLVSIVSLFELTGAVKLAISGDVAWRAYSLEVYLFVALIYWGFCHTLEWLRKNA
ncbi:MAG: amino acid ABC transporter permease [Limnobacter sp.]|nr:amino acid ABC transporter permease [Limnobacter sp.]